VRLALVTNDYPPRPGGIQQYLGNLVDAWPHPVLVLAGAGAAATTRRGEAVVRRHRRNFMWPTPGVARWVESAVADFEADVVVFGAPYPLTRLGPALRSRLGIPFAVIGHGAEVVLPAAIPGVRQLLAHTLAAADVRFAVSRFTAARLERLTGRPVAYLGAGVDAELFRPAASPPAGPTVVGCVSRFVPRKGQHRLIEATARLQQSGREVELLLVGKGRTEASLRRLARRRGVDAGFAVDVAWAELPDLYRRMNVFCMPCRSRWLGLEAEGLGLVYLEAAASGLPVLAGTSGGAPETVDPGRTGYVVHSVDDIVQAVTLLADHPATAAAMALAGRRRMERYFTWEAVAGRLEAGLATLPEE
jgi:phosphatidylinositol alpha-1,6-mannosyltransferase